MSLLTLRPALGVYCDGLQVRFMGAALLYFYVSQSDHLSFMQRVPGWSLHWTQCSLATKLKVYLALFCALFLFLHASTTTAGPYLHSGIL